MKPALYIFLTLLLGLLPDSVVAKGGGGKGGGGGKSSGGKSSSSRPIIFVPATGGNAAYCRDQLTNAVTKCPNNKSRNIAIIVVCSVVGGILLCAALCCWRRSRKQSKRDAAVHPMNRQFTLGMDPHPAHTPANDPAPKKAVSWLDRIALARPRQYSLPVFESKQGKYEKVSSGKSSPPPTQISFPSPAHYDDQSSQSGVKK